ncbi:MAG: GGDEF domain-containing protein, partial [Gammaproteobacteria bacterium]
EQPFVLNDTNFHVTASIGISLFPGDGEDTSTLLRNADLAMYRAKDEGRNSYEFYSSEMTVRVFERLNMENSLRMALERDEYILHYQPQVDIHSGKIVGVEALLRWQHPEFGLMSPDRFVPCLEDTGLIIPVGSWVLSRACEQLAQWRSCGHNELAMSVNISSRQFNSPGLVVELTELMQRYKFPEALLELEITESVMMSHADSAQQLFDAIKALGISLAVDDFGTGYSSLSYLRRLSIDALKIDRSFIVDCPVDPDDAAIAEAIVSLARTLRLKVVAEGVETGGQLEFLNMIGCNIAQGYLFSNPLPPEKISDLLVQQPLVSGG